MNYQNIICNLEEGIFYITINRPKQLNSLNKLTIQELNDAIVEADKNKTARCIILTGSGDKSFVAGADIKEFASFDSKQGEALSKEGHDLLFDLLENLSTPSIAAINGFALGGGLELAMSAHIRIASETAKMGLPEVSLGVIPGYGGTQRLTRLVGKGIAIEMITTAKMINAEQAKEIGLVNQVTKPDNLIPTAKKIADKIIKNSPSAISRAIKSINASEKFNVNGYEVEQKQFGMCFGTTEFTEGVNAFMEKRKPNF